MFVVRMVRFLKVEAVFGHNGELSASVLSLRVKFVLVDENIFQKVVSVDRKRDYSAQKD